MVGKCIIYFSPEQVYRFPAQDGWTVFHRLWWWRIEIDIDNFSDGRFATLPNFGSSLWFCERKSKCNAMSFDRDVNWESFSHSFSRLNSLSFTYYGGCFTRSCWYEMKWSWNFLLANRMALEIFSQTDALNIRINNSKCIPFGFRWHINNRKITIKTEFTSTIEFRRQ